MSSIQRGLFFFLKYIYIYFTVFGELRTKRKPYLPVSWSMLKYRCDTGGHRSLSPIWEGVRHPSDFPKVSTASTACSKARLHDSVKLKSPQREGFKTSKHRKPEKEGSSKETAAPLLGGVRKRISNLECSITAHAAPQGHQVRSPALTRGQAHLPPSPSHTPSNETQDAAGLLCSKGVLLAHTQSAAPKSSFAFKRHDLF